MKSMYNFKRPNLAILQNISNIIINNHNKMFSEIYERMQKGLQEQEQTLRMLSTKQGIAFPLSLPIQMLHEFTDNKGNNRNVSLNYSYWINEENFYFISYVQDEVNQVYKNDYINKQFELMKHHDLNLFPPFLLILIEKLCRKIIDKENDRLPYKTITEKLLLEWDNIVNINNLDAFINDYYKDIFNNVINKQIYIDEKYYEPSSKNYNRHRVLHAKTDFDEFTIEKTSNLLFVIMFLVDIINFNNELK